MQLSLENIIWTQQHDWLAAICGAFCNQSMRVFLVEVGAEKARLSNETIAILFAVSEGPANAPPAQSSAANIHQILHENVGRVLGTAASRFQHGKSSVHEHYKSSTEAKPGWIKSSAKSKVGSLVFTKFPSYHILSILDQLRNNRNTCEVMWNEGSWKSSNTQQNVLNTN